MMYENFGGVLAVLVWNMDFQNWFQNVGDIPVCVDFDFRGDFDKCKGSSTTYCSDNHEFGPKAFAANFHIVLGGPIFVRVVN